MFGFVVLMLEVVSKVSMGLGGMLGVWMWYVIVEEKV